MVLVFARRCEIRRLRGQTRRADSLLRVDSPSSSLKRTSVLSWRSFSAFVTPTGVSHVCLRRGIFYLAVPILPSPSTGGRVTRMRCLLRDFVPSCVWRRAHFRVWWLDSTQLRWSYFTRRMGAPSFLCLHSWKLLCTEQIIAAMARPLVRSPGTLACVRKLL